MILTFYSEVGGGCTTSNALAIAMQAGISNKKTVLLDMAYNANPWAQIALIGRPDDSAHNYYENVGMDAMLRNVTAGTLEEENIRDAETEISSNLFYVPRTIRINKELYLQELKEGLPVLLKALDRYHDFVILDIGVGTKLQEVFQLVKESNNLFVVNLPQNIHAVEDCLKKNEKEQPFFLIGNYNSNSRHTIRNIRKKYHIPVAGILHNPEFSDAIQDTALLKFFYRNEHCDEMEYNYPFIQQCKGAFDQIINAVERKAEEYDH